MFSRSSKKNWAHICARRGKAVKSAFSSHYHWENITSDHVCPYGIMPCPQRIRKNEGGHHDSSDCIDNEQGCIVADYIKTTKSPIISDYFDRMYAMFHASIK